MHNSNTFVMKAKRNQLHHFQENLESTISVFINEICPPFFFFCFSGRLLQHWYLYTRYLVLDDIVRYFMQDNANNTICTKSVASWRTTVFPCLPKEEETFSEKCMKNYNGREEQCLLKQLNNHIQIQYHPAKLLQDIM